MAKRCLVVSYYFPPVGGGGVQRIVKMIKYVSRWGWQFTVITASEDAKTQPLDHSLQEEIPDNCQIIRLKSKMPVKKNRIIQKIPGLNDASYWKRWISAFLYIPDMRKSWLPLAKSAINEELKNEKYNCILITSPPYSLAKLAGELQNEVHIPVILDMRDPWTTNPYKIHPTKIHLKKDWLLEEQAISGIKYGISAYKNIIDLYESKINNFNPINWRIIPNGYDEEDYRKFTTPDLDKRFFNIAFSGTFYSHINNPKYLFQAMAQLIKEDSQTGRRIRFHHIGKSYIDINKLAKKYRIHDQVVQLGYLNHKECLEVLNGMDALCFILDDRQKNSDKTIGGKVYEYLRLMKPILALVPENGEAAQLIKTTESGKVIAPGRTGEIVKTLKSWINNPPVFKYKGVENFSRELQVKSFLELLNEVSET